MSCIDYDQLKTLNAEASLSPLSKQNVIGRHEKLMKSFDSIFLKPQKPLPGIPNQPTKAFQLAHAHIKRPKSRFAAYREKFLTDDQPDPPTQYDTRFSHDIRYYTTRKSKKRGDDGPSKTEDLIFNKERNISALQILMKKLPFERSRKEQRRVYRLLKDLWPTELSSMLEDSKAQYPVLKELASVATLDTYHDAGFTVFGNTGLHLVLRGSLYPQTLPCLRGDVEPDKTDEDDFACPTPILRRKYVHKLTPGEWFGTLKKVEGREINSKVLTLITLEPCQFLKISIADYQRILTRIKQRIQTEKMSVIQAVPPYNKWAGMSVGKLAAILEWKTFPAGSVVMGEGEISPYIVFIRHGKCEVFRQVEAIKTLPNGRKRRLFKNVLMGELNEGDALGEYSIVEQKPFICTVVSTTDLDVGVIFPQKLDELDTTIRTLLAQSVQPKFANITDDDIHSNFIQQEMKDDWSQLKHKVLLQTINHCGIRPGYGKWSNPAVLKGNF